MVVRVISIGGSLLLLASLGIAALLYYQARQQRETNGQYVALGSSFAAGIGLGPRAPGSPLVCVRTASGYPNLLARMLGLKLVDRSCSGSTTAHVLRKGRFFLTPQLDAVGPETVLVTITSGGNDVGYIGDLTFAAGAAGQLGKLFWKGPQPVEQRDFAQVTENLVGVVEVIKIRAPKAKVVLVSYPTVLPASGTCDTLGITDEMANTTRQVAGKLEAATLAAAEQSGATYVDMAAISIGHDACSATPWVNGAGRGGGTPFHPNAAGAKATAQAIFAAVSAADR